MIEKRGSNPEGEHTVDLELAVGDNGLDLALLLEVLQASSRQRAVDLHSVDEDGNCDEAVGLDILVELLGSVLVEHDGMLGLVLDCSRKRSQYHVPSIPSSSFPPRPRHTTNILYRRGRILLIIVVSTSIRSPPLPSIASTSIRNRRRKHVYAIPFCGYFNKVP